MSNYIYTIRPASFESLAGTTFGTDALTGTQTLWQGFIKGQCFPEDDARMRWEIEIDGTVSGNNPYTNMFARDSLGVVLYDDTNSVIVHKRNYIVAYPYLIPTDPFPTTGGIPNPAVVSGPRWGVPTPTADSKLRIYASWTAPAAGAPLHYYSTYTIRAVNVLAWRV